MLKFVIRKMFSKKWMVLSLLIGNILLVSIAAGNPMYTQAVFQRTLSKNLETHLMEKNEYPGLMTLKLGTAVRERSVIERYAQAADEMPQRFGVDARHSIQVLSTGSVMGPLDRPRDDVQDAKLSLCAMTGMENHVRLLAGRMYAAQPDEAGVIDVIVSQSAMKQINVLLEDVITLPRVLDTDGEPLRIRIAGVYENSSSTDEYWVRSPSSYSDACFMDPALFERKLLSQEELPSAVMGTWYTLLDYTAMRGDEAEHMLDVMQSYEEQFNGELIKYYTASFSKVLTDYISTVKKVNTTLWVLQIPIFVLLASFIFMVSQQMLSIEQNEIAVIKSRGAGRRQIFIMYLLQSLIIALLSLAAGLPLGAYLVQVLGSANAFLEFVRRSALPVEINARALAFAMGAAGLSVCAMVLPVIRYSKTGIVSHKRQKNRKSSTPMWQKVGLDFLLLGVALYGLYTFNGQKEILAARVQEGASLDPVLFLSSSLFMIGSGLLAVRLAPVLVWSVFGLFKRVLSPALYASFLHVLRTRSRQSFMMVFLIMTIALGVFNAQAARTINQNMEDNLRYAIGADMVLKETWDSIEDTSPGSSQSAATLTYIEPDYGRYETLKGAASKTKVYVNENVTVSVSKGALKGVTLMGIHTREFGETAWFKDSLSDVHWYHYLNAMAQNSRAILVSRNFAEEYKYKIGDSITYANAAGDDLRGVIYGFVDYFPGFEPVVYKLGTNGLYTEQERFLIVAHLSQVQATWGVEPYEIWFKNQDGGDYLYQFMEENDIVGKLQDASLELVEKKNDPVLQGTNGILTVGFIVVLLLCSVGFLIYWILSIQSRSLLFGIFRAMGMSMREVFTMLINEQIFISGLSIGIGALVGKLTAHLYMPLIQMGYAASDNALPLEVISLASDNVRLFAIIGAVMLICMMILGGLISHMKIAQALKLGED